ncbi:hypothetical protein [Pollutibacter soli]|uniref:hypothetical protein n=1 Tax=Pollutibacter soli TaxID=3034157 RepID=UPI0030134749
MTHRLTGILLLLFFASCSESHNGIPLSEFSYNGKTKNEWIVNRIPVYGTGKRDGCEILKEISLELENSGNRYTGRIFDSKSDSGLANVKVMIRYADGTAPSEAISDQDGKLDFTADEIFEKLIIWQTGYRVLVIQSHNNKLQALVK